MLLEVCVGSIDDALVAERGGADRLELCGALELGGLTPSLALIEQVTAATALPVMVMIRPRAAGFCYSDGDFRVMLRDAELALGAGAKGIVFGVLDEQSGLDDAKIKRLVEVAGPNETVFHRAFDFVRDPLRSLDRLIDLGVNRILTTGGEATAMEGVESLARLAKHAAGRIEIMPAGGVSAENIAELLRSSGCHQFHTGAAISAIDPSLSRANASSLSDLPRLSAGEFRMVAEKRVSELKKAAGQIGTKRP